MLNRDSVFYVQIACSCNIIRAILFLLLLQMMCGIAVTHLIRVALFFLCCSSHLGCFYTVLFILIFLALIVLHATCHLPYSYSYNACMQLSSPLANLLNCLALNKFIRPPITHCQHFEYKLQVLPPLCRQMFACAHYAALSTATPSQLQHIVCTFQLNERVHMYVCIYIHINEYLLTAFCSFCIF